MIKKILVMVFYWTTFFAFYILILNEINAIQDGTLKQILLFIVLLILSLRMQKSMHKSLEYVTNKGNK